MSFDSITKCKGYLSTIGIHRSLSTVSSWCLNKQCKYGLHFSFQNRDKYYRSTNYTITNKVGEVWRLFHKGKRVHYYISSMGRIKSRLITNGRELEISLHISDGYYRCSIHSLGSRCVHRLVAKHFVENPNNYGMVDHINTIRTNNEASNLRWVKNQKENYDNEQSRKNKSINIMVEQLSLIDGSVLKRWDRVSIVRRELGFQCGPILRVCRKQGKT
eukprot:209459_1